MCPSPLKYAPQTVVECWRKAKRMKGMLHCNRLQGDSLTGSHPAATGDLLLQILRASIFSNPVNMVTVTKFGHPFIFNCFVKISVNQKKKFWHTNIYFSSYYQFLFFHHYQNRWISHCNNIWSKKKAGVTTHFYRFSYYFYFNRINIKLVS